jgi:hypothetical protein
MKKNLLFSLFALVSCIVIAQEDSINEKPVALWVSYPVSEGDNVLVHGGNWGKDVKVEIGGKHFSSTVLSDTGLVFTYPSKKEEILEGRLVNSAGVSAPFSINSPTVWWIQGDAGDSSSPGGTLRVFGRSLAASDENVKVKPRIMLGKREIPLDKYDTWSLDGRIPDDFPAGEYQVKISNSLPGGKDWYDAGIWHIKPREHFWKE